MKVPEAIKMLRQAADELEKYFSHECYGENTELKIVVHDPTEHIMRHCDVDQVNQGEYIHGGYYRKHLFLDFCVRIDKDWHSNPKDHTWIGSTQ